MVTFTIDNDNNITAFGSPEQAASDGDSTRISFDSQATLAKISAEWPLSRFVDIWNSIPGHPVVRKFANRTNATARIWAAVQRLNPERQPATTEASKRAKTPTSANSQRSAKKSRQAAVSAPARNNKKAAVIAMMKRAKGVRLFEIVSATQWQAHTVRGFVSILGSKGGAKIESSKDARGERRYRILN